MSLPRTKWTLESKKRKRYGFRKRLRRRYITRKERDVNLQIMFLGGQRDELSPDESGLELMKNIKGRWTSINQEI